MCIIFFWRKKKRVLNGIYTVRNMKQFKKSLSYTKENELDKMLDLLTPFIEEMRSHEDNIFIHCRSDDRAFIIKESDKDFTLLKEAGRNRLLTVYRY